MLQSTAYICYVDAVSERGLVALFRLLAWGAAVLACCIGHPLNVCTGPSRDHAGNDRTPGHDDDDTLTGAQALSSAPWWTRFLQA